MFVGLLGIPQNQTLDLPLYQIVIYTNKYLYNYLIQDRVIT